MSKSRKKPIIKDVGFMKRDYWRVVRRVHKQEIRKQKRDFSYLGWEDDFVLKNPKSIINDYDYCDWRSEMESITEKQLNKYTFIDKEYIEKYTRK